MKLGFHSQSMPVMMVLLRPVSLAPASSMFSTASFAASSCSRNSFTPSIESTRVTGSIDCENTSVKLRKSTPTPISGNDAASCSLLNSDELCICLVAFCFFIMSEGDSRSCLDLEASRAPPCSRMLNDCTTISNDLFCIQLPNESRLPTFVRPLTRSNCPGLNFLRAAGPCTSPKALHSVFPAMSCTAMSLPSSPDRHGKSYWSCLVPSPT
mmetsp:Transcript_18948/g.28029  ORF Transcript_18948/g.28029 Transcript_18948/m.28029 type:complete len:211 (-) Transcript_18948:164-796(-)